MSKGKSFCFSVCIVALVSDSVLHRLKSIDDIDDMIMDFLELAHGPAASLMDGCCCLCRLEDRCWMSITLEL